MARDPHPSDQQPLTSDQRCVAPPQRPVAPPQRRATPSLTTSGAWPLPKDPRLLPSGARPPPKGSTAPTQRPAACGPSSRTHSPPQQRRTPSPMTRSPFPAAINLIINCSPALSILEPHLRAVPHRSRSTIDRRDHRSQPHQSLVPVPLIDATIRLVTSFSIRSIHHQLQVLKKVDMIHKNAVESILAERDILITIRNPFVGKEKAYCAGGDVVVAIHSISKGILTILLLPFGHNCMCM